MSVFHRWIVLCLIVISLLTLTALAVSRNILSDTTIEFRVANGRGIYHYLYDYRTEWLYLDEQWPLATQIAPNGEFGLIINRGSGSTIIDYVSESGLREHLGEFPFAATDVVAQWSADSENIYLQGRSDDIITIYGIEIASSKMTAVVEYEVLPSQRFFFDYYPEQDIFTLQFNNIPANTYTLLYVYELASQKKWTIEGSSITSHENGTTYVSLTSPEGDGEADVLNYISVRDNHEQSLPLPPEGQVVHVDFLRDESQVIITTINPDKSYIFDLKTGNYIKLADRALMNIFVPNSWDAYLLDYHTFINGYAYSAAWYELDLETYDISDFLEPNWVRIPINIMYNSISVSPNKRKLAMMTLRQQGIMSVVIVSLQTGELLHQFEIPAGLSVSNQSHANYVLKWYAP